MTAAAFFSNGFCSALFSATLVIVLTGPKSYIAPTFVCGFVAYAVREIWVAGGMGVNWATVIAAAAAVVVAAIVTPKHQLSPVVVISAILPLSAALSVFQAILDLVSVSYARGEALAEVSVTLSANVGTAFTTTTAIVLGLQIGIGIVRGLGRRAEV